jgi:glycine/serine hydroxymethyltransferase
MKKIAELIHLTVTDYEEKSGNIRAEVDKLCDKYPLYS